MKRAKNNGQNSSRFIFKRRKFPNYHVSNVDCSSNFPSSSLSTIITDEVDKRIDNLVANNGGTHLTESKVIRNAEKLIPEFDPENRDINVKSWIKKIEQLGVIYKWSDEEKSFNLQSKLQGQARVWFNRLDSYDHTWEDWKSMIIKAFPRYYDYATLLDELTSRKKLQSETMTKYFQEKLAMCYRCQLSDQASISCIIRGLPSELQANAQAFQCSSPDELYEGFLSALESYQPTQGKGNFTIKATQSRSNEIYQKKPPICYRCNETGHVVPECTKPDDRRCFRCGKQGHIANNCKITVDHPKGSEKKIQILSKINNVYMKSSKINNVYAQCYLDTGSELNVMSESAARAMKLKIEPSNVTLKGFTGQPILAKGQVNFRLLVDEVDTTTSAVITDVDMGKIVLLIGQPVINDKNTRLNVSHNKATLSRISTFNDLNCIDIVNEANHCRVIIADDTEVPVGSSLINVRTDRLCTGLWCTKPRQYSYGGVTYGLAGSILQDGCGYVKICNIGEQPIYLQKDKTITRAERCNAVGEVSANLYSLHTNSNICDKTIGGIKLNEIDVGEINAGDKQTLYNMLHTFSDCFASSLREIGTTNLGEMHIKVTSDKPVNRKPYRLAYSEKEVVTKKVQELLDSKIIRESNSEYASPIILVKKKNGDYRLCVDYRALNSITVKEHFPLPHIDDELSKLAGKRVFTNLDMYSGYHHVKIHPNSINKTAFVTPDGSYEFLRVPFGLANAPSVFMRVMNKLIKLVGSQELICFMDDILLSSVNCTEGLKLLEKVLLRLRESNLKLNIKKCSFLKSEVSFLGHEIGSDGIRPGNHKILAVTNFKTPSNLHELRQFLGLCSYFRKFIEKFAILAKPLTDLTKKDVSWSWGFDQIQSFNTLKQKLSSRPVLALFNEKLSCEIHTDACKNGIAGILLQKQDNGGLNPIFYYSRVTSREECNYHSYELETLAVVESLKRFRVYILGKPVKIVTDCSAVRYTLQKRDLVPRIARWWISIQEYDIQIEYRPGERMKHVDALSRNPNICHISEHDANLYHSKLFQISSEDWYLTVQLQDDKLSNIIKQLNENTASRDIINNFKIKNNRLYRKTLAGDRLVVPSFGRWKLLQKYHDQIGHIGLRRCDELIKADYWFPKMTRFIKKYVKSCFECAYSKGEYGKPSGQLYPIPKPTVPMDTLHIDHLGPFCRTKKGHQYLLVIVDSFTKFLIARPSRTINSIETVNILRDVFSLFGYPKRVISDRNLAFTSRIFKEFSTQYQFRHSLNSIACPRANGQVERYNRTLLDAMRTRVKDPNMWTECIPDVIWGINNTRNESVGYHPYELMFSVRGRLLPNLAGSDTIGTPVQEKRVKASKRLQRQAEAMKRNYDKRHKREQTFTKGDLVLWKQAPTGGEAKSVNTKLQVLYSGPYIIHKVLGHGRYQIKSIQGMRGYKKFLGIVAADALRPYRSAPACSETSSDEDVVTRDDLIDLLES